MIVDIRTGWLDTKEGLNINDLDPSKEKEKEKEKEKLEEGEEDEEGDDFVDDAYKITSGGVQKRTALEKGELDKLRQVRGFPYGWQVEPAPAIRVCLPKDAFVGREWKATVESESGEVGALTATATLEDGTAVPVNIEGYWFYSVRKYNLFQKFHFICDAYRNVVNSERKHQM
jgi:hypothetical protein